jgi:hypothetical protein
VSFKISNYAASPHKILGIRSDCTCLETENLLPAMIPAGGKLNLSIVVRRRSEAEALKEAVSVFTDCGDQPQIVLHVSGRF